MDGVNGKGFSLSGKAEFTEAEFPKGKSWGINGHINREDIKDLINYAGGSCPPSKKKFSCDYLIKSYPIQNKYQGEHQTEKERKAKKRSAELIDCRTSDGRKKFIAILINAMKSIKKEYGIDAYNYKDIISQVREIEMRNRI